MSLSGKFKMATNWRFVFNPLQQNDQRFDGDRSTATDMAREIGYPFLAWNDRIYEVQKNFLEDTGLIVDKDGKIVLE